MPEVVLYNSIKSILQIIKTDHLANPTSSLLYYAFKKDVNNSDIALDTLNFFDQAVSVFVDKRVNLNLGYNLEVASLNAIHILLPGENSRPLTIGADAGYEAPIEGDDGALNDVFNVMTDVTYQLMISGENSTEVIIIYNMLKLALLSYYSHLELSGLRDIKFGGADVVLQQDLVPPNIFHRNLSLTFMYESSIPTSFRNTIVTAIHLLKPTIITP